MAANTELVVYAAANSLLHAAIVSVVEPVTTCTVLYGSLETLVI